MRKILAVAGIAVAVVVLLVASLSSSRGYASLPLINSLTPTPAHSPAQGREDELKIPSGRPTGVQAIDPPVTEAKVQQYVKQHLAQGGIAASNIGVLSIRFLTVAELETLMSTNDPYWDSFPPDEPLVLVHLSGDFSYSDMSDMRHLAQRAYKVFSARTGNELMGGVLR